MKRANDSNFGCRLFVGNLSEGVDDNALSLAFEQHGNVEEAKVIRDRATGMTKAYGFVTFSDERKARIACDAMNGASLGGKSIRVNKASAREERSGGRGGGGRGGGGRGRGRHTGQEDLGK